jgi:hypothetical protein
MGLYGEPGTGSRRNITAFLERKGARGLGYPSDPRHAAVLDTKFQWVDPMDNYTTFYFLVGVQIEYDVLHLRTSLVQLFALLQLNFEEVVQIIELRRFRGAPNGYPFAALLFGFRVIGLTH